MLREVQRPTGGAAAGHEPLLAFGVSGGDAELELRINFGLFAGREVTPAEIDDLGVELVGRVGSVTIVSERTHEIGPTAQATLHQVVVRIGSGELPEDDADLAELRGRLLEVSERWAHACIADRHDPVGDDLQELLS